MPVVASSIVPWVLDVEPTRGDRFHAEVESEPLVVGRGEGCGLRLADPQVSRQHTRFSLRGHELWVEDLESRNGTRVNGTAIKGARRLAEGDIVELSGNRFVVTLSAKDPAPDTASSGLEAHFRDATLFLPSDPLSSGGSSSEAEIRRYAERLRLIAEVHQSLAGLSSESEVLELVLERVFLHLRPEQAAVMLLDERGEARLAASRPRGIATGDVFFSRSLMREVVDKRLAALVLDARADERFALAKSILTSGVRSLIAAPLLTGDRALGLIVLSSALHVRQFGEEDLEVLVSLGSAAALQLRNLGLLVEAAERRRLEQELAHARRIQVALLPDELPELAGWSILAGNVPSRGVSGDLYTVTSRRGDSELVFLIADVSGKGMAASLLGASLEALSIEPIEIGLDAHEICDRVSRRLYQRTPAERYATGFVAILEPATATLHWCNAGHNPALLLRKDGAVEQLGSSGPPLGLLLTATYKVNTLTFAPGDLLVIYTDGITEASDPDDEEFGLARLTAVCSDHRAEDLPQLRRTIEIAIDGFVRGTPFADDRTLLLLRRE